MDTITLLGYSSKCNLYLWIKNHNLYLKEKLKIMSVNIPEYPWYISVGLKLKILYRCFELGKDVNSLKKIGYGRASIYAIEEKIYPEINSCTYE